MHAPQIFTSCENSEGKSFWHKITILHHWHSATFPGQTKTSSLLYMGFAQPTLKLT
jgi:hypothetical protein